MCLDSKEKYKKLFQKIANENIVTNITSWKIISLLLLTRERAL